MTAKPAKRPAWILLAIGLGAVVGGARGWDTLGGLFVGIGVTCVGLYVDRALRWLKDRP